MMLERLVQCVIALALILPVPHVAFAQSPAAPEASKPKTRGLAFTKLVRRQKGKGSITVSDAETQIVVTEYLRKKGINGLGADSVVFGRDRSSEAQVALSGPIFEMDCIVTHEPHCRMGIEWELFDVTLDQVVYRARVYGESHRPRTSNSATARALIGSALKDLLDNPKFRELLEPVTQRDLEKSPYSATSIQTCSRPATPVEAGADSALEAVAVVASKNGFGSGFFMSDGPYLLTAAHVVETTPLTIRFRNGHESPGTPVRVDRSADVALVRVDEPPDEHGCLQLAAASSVKVGGPVYAMGSPASEELSFSVTRGILSGVRNAQGIRRYQTDAAISPGNSGGPLLDGNGSALGITSFKLTGDAVEGIAFAISAQDALLRLGLTLASQTDPTLATEKHLTSDANGKVFEEPPEARPVLDAAADARKAEAERKQKIRDHREEMTPGIVPWLRWGGVATAGVGAIGVLYTALAADGGDTRGQYDTYVAINTIAWGLLGAGVVATVVSFPLTPTLKEAEADLDRGTTFSLSVTPGPSVLISGSF